MADNVSDQLAWERRAGRIAGVAAALAAVLFIAGGLYLQISVERRPTGANELVTAIGRDSTDYVIAGILSALAALLLGAVLAYLYRVVRFRRQNVPSAALALAIFGALGAAAVAIGRPVDLGMAAADFPSAALRTPEGTEELLRDRTSLQIIGGVGLAANLALAFAIVLISINAMRSGILSRFLGVLGIVIGVLLPLVGPMPVLLFFWLAALAALFLDRWPRGRGPAWASGEALPWPTVAMRNAELDRRRVAAEVGEDEDADAAESAEPAETRQADGDPVGAATDRPADGDEPTGSSRAAKRKRGRRR